MSTLTQRTVLTQEPQILAPGWKFLWGGKVRRMFQGNSEDTLLLVGTDNISAFDVVLPTKIPGKGEILTQMSVFWFWLTRGIVDSHFMRLLQEDELPHPHLVGRVMEVKRAERIDVEAVARKHITGSAWAEYRRSGTICGKKYPSGMTEGEAFPEAIFTPTTKAESGHDLPLTDKELVTLIGYQLAERLRKLTIELLEFAYKWAGKRGIILADTKVEFGTLPDGSLVVIDELFTPDSSRFWDADQFQLGTSPPSYDKQYVRNYLEATGWNKEPPAPELPSDVVAKTQEKYETALARLTGPERI